MSIRISLIFFILSFVKPIITQDLTTKESSIKSKVKIKNQEESNNSFNFEGIEINDFSKKPRKIDKSNDLVVNKKLNSKEKIKSHKKIQKKMTRSIETKSLVKSKKVKKKSNKIISHKEQEDKGHKIYSDTFFSNEIISNQRSRLENVLNYKTGLFISKTGQSGHQTSLFIRGHESDYTSVFINGRRLPAGFAGTYSIENLNVSTFESVQIYKGAISSLYGSDAIAGVIELNGTDARYIKENSLEGFLEGGSFNFYSVGNRLALVEGPIKIAFNSSFSDTENDEINSEYANKVYYTNIAYEFDEGIYFDILGYFQDSTVGVPGSRLGFGGFSSFPNDEINKNKLNLVSPRVSINKDYWNFYILYSKSESDFSTEKASFGDSLLTQKSDEIEAKVGLNVSDNIKFDLGVGHYSYKFDRKSLDGSPLFGIEEFGFGYTGVYGQVDVDLSKNTNLLASYRYDFHDSFKSKGSYLLKLTQFIDKTNTRLFAKVSTGYKPPAAQVYTFLDPFATPTINPNVFKPEETRSWEVGLNQLLFDEKFNLGVTYFNSKMDNLANLDFDLMPIVEFSDSQGVETKLKYNPISGVDIYFNYTYLYAFNVDENRNKIIQKPRVPEHSISGGIVFSFDKWKLGMELTGAYDRIDSVFGNSSDLENFTVARIFGDIQISKNVNLYGRVENVFDEEYQSVSGYNASGSAYFLGIKYVY